MIPDVTATAQTILVVGAGISGMTSALEAAEAGKRVVLLERLPFIGGRITQLHRYFPKLCPPSCGLEINLRRIKSNPNITLLTQAELTQLNGIAGDYKAKITVHPRYVNDNCTACGACAQSLTAEFENEFDYGMSFRKGAYLPHNMAYPQRYVIDPRIIGTEDAQRVENACRYQAVDFSMQPQTLELPVAAVIWATGWKPYDAAKIQPYGYGHIANVITSVEMERMLDPFGPTKGRILRPSDKREAQDIAFIQCAGSRDHNHLKHCSRVCCMVSLKQSQYVSQCYGEAALSTIYYIDIRAIDRFEDFSRRVLGDPQVRLIKSKVAKIVADPQSDDPVLHGVNTEGCQSYTNRHDLVVLAIGMQPNVPKAALPFEVRLNRDGFIEPDVANGAIFASGCTADALDVNRSVQSATAAALRAVQVINRNAMETQE